MLKEIAKEISPPFLYAILKKKFRRDERPYNPAWHTIQGGILKGRELFLDPKDGLWQKEMLEGKYDSYIFDYLRPLNLEGKTIFDIGSHIGYHAMHFASLVGDKGCVCAFEPNRFNRERMDIILKRSPELARRIRIFDVAISDGDGEEEFHFARDVDKGTSSGSFIDKAHTFYPKSKEYLESFETITTKTVSLDRLSPLLDRDVIPDVIKIDVEGAESSVLQGAIGMLKKQRPLIVMEVHSIYNMFRTSEILRSTHYKMVLLKEEIDGRCFIAAEPLAEVLP